VLRDLDTSGFDAAHKALFRFVEKINAQCSRVTAADFEPLRALGWTDDALYFAVTVCALFNFYNRWVDGCGVHALSDEAHRQGARRMALHGYAR
jgi:alkylhydroperoxidase family enzyme